MSTETHTQGAIDGTGGFVAGWLAPGDDLFSGGEVPAGLYGLRLHGTDTELLGTPAELGELADRMAARWVSRHVDSFNDFADRLGLVLERGFTRFPQDLSCADVDAFALTLALRGHHDEAAQLIGIHCDVDVNGEEHAHIQALVEAADILAGAASVGGRIVESDYTEADAAAHAYVRTLLPDGTETGSDRAQKKAWFLALTAEARRLDAEADQLREEANESGRTNNELEVRERAGQTAREALAVAEMLLG